MKRILLNLVCCSPLLFSAPFVHSVELVGPVDEVVLSVEQYGPISSSETLWGLSNKLRPDNSVSVYQTLVAIYKLNPYAFYKGDVDNIIPLSIIKIPSLTFISKQSNDDAYRLLKKVKKTTTSNKVKKIASSKELTLLKSANAKLESTLESEKVALLSAEELIAKQEKDLFQINEQLLIAIEMNQELKSKFQPLSEQIDLLSERVESEMLVQNELQALIEQYRTQIAAFVAPPYSGEGWLNELLRTITSSLTNLLLVIFSPLLLLLAIIMVILRIKSKRILAMQEQELAESTTILMEQSGKFDSLLSDDLDRQYDNVNDIDFTQELEVEPSASVTEKMKNTESADLEEDALISDNAASIDTQNDDDFDIDALFSETEEAIELSDIDPSLVLDSHQADLDLAAQWESQLAAEAQAEEMQVEETWDNENTAIEIASQKSVNADMETVLDVDAIDELIENQDAFNVDDLINIDKKSIEAAISITANDNLQDVEMVISSVSVDSVDDLSEFENVDISTLKNIDESLSELDAELENASTEQDIESTDELVKNDSLLLAKQLSSVAFDDSLPLPKVDKATASEFIDINTLLEESNHSVDVSEDEFNLDFGLDEFPDVVSSFSEFDSDDNGVAAQLDLARAYLEIDDKKSAKEILTALSDKATDENLKEVQKLLNRMN